MGNADGTPVFFDMTASPTVDTEGSRSVLTKQQDMKNRTAVMFSNPD
jgi:hypothetical protein